jgi:lysyl-tRNA synthetase class 2
MNTKAHSWQPTADLAHIKLRSQVLWDLRNFFHSLGFAEVHTPVLSRDTVVDRHIDPISLPANAVSVAELSDDTFYLQTSPEFCMKRMLAAGADSIYQIAQVFRSGERGTYHNPEFTMVEWYRVGDDLSAAVGLLSQLLQAVIPDCQPIRQSYRDAFLQYVGLCPLESSVAELSKAALAHSLAVDANWSSDRDDWLNLLFSEVVQPSLGQVHPAIIIDYPASQSALAQLSKEDYRVAQRFELFIAGIELANGYHELLEATELSSRNQIVNQQRLRDGKVALPAESRLLDAMRSGLPACSGCALGLDRLLMVISQAQRIDQVIAFPIELA